MVKRSHIVMGMLALFLAAIGALLLAAYPHTSQSSGPVVHHIKEATFGCQSLDTANQIGRLIGEHDRAAQMEVIQQGFASGDCANLNVGVAVYVEEMKLDGLIKVRPQGSALTYWTVSNAVGP